MMRASRDALMKAIMADGWDEEEAPASCEVQVELKFEI